MRPPLLLVGLGLAGGVLGEAGAPGPSPLGTTSCTLDPGVERCGFYCPPRPTLRVEAVGPLAVAASARCSSWDGSDVAACEGLVVCRAEEAGRYMGQVLGLCEARADVRLVRATCSAT